MIEFKIRINSRVGEHVNITLFSRKYGSATYMSNGELCFSVDEYAAFVENIGLGAISSGNPLELVDKEGTNGNKINNSIVIDKLISFSGMC